MYACYQIFTVILLFINIACKFSIQPDTSLILNGIVSDRLGNPVAGAMIELEYFPDHGDVNLPKAQTPQINTIIHFGIPEPGPVKVWITRYGETDTVKVLMKEMAMAGNYMLIWDGRNGAGQRAINYIYQSHVWYNGDLESTSMFVSGEYDGEVDPDSLEYYTLTDEAGKFTIPADKLACTLDTEIEVSDELGNKLGTVKLSQEIRVWALHHALGKTVSEKLTFRTDGPTSVRIQF